MRSTRSAISRRVVDAKRVALHLHTAEDDGQTQKGIRLDNDRRKVHVIGNSICILFSGYDMIKHMHNMYNKNTVPFCLKSITNRLKLL